MTGYTRQSAAEIQDGEIVEATPLNAEFNQLQSAFNSSLGHTHDGTLGNGPKISLTGAITGVLPVVNGGFNAIHNVTATTAPTGLQDITQGYGYGSHWMDTVAKQVYICVDPSPTAAIWVTYQYLNAALSSLAGLTTVADKMLYTTAANTYATTSVTPYVRTILDDTDASTVLSTLGVSAYIKTVLDDVDATTARGTLGLGTMATQNSNAVTLTGGTISGVSITGTLNTASANITGGTITGITDLTVADGGTGASTAASARANLGLSNVDNTTDVGKPVSTAQAAADAAVLVQAAPPGLVGMFAMNSAPAGWLKANGALVSRSSYSALFTQIGTLYGAGDGSTTFALPDYRGYFPRAWDDARGIDSGRTLGTVQASQNLSHNHTLTDPSHAHSISDGGHNHGVNDPGHSHPFGASYIGSGIGSNGGYVNATNNGGANTGAVGTGIYLSASGTGIGIYGNYTGITLAASGGTEARPSNMSILFCIKY
jgi:hypothetical protein